MAIVAIESAEIDKLSQPSVITDVIEAVTYPRERREIFLKLSML
jgi:hypothetical protein